MMPCDWVIGPIGDILSEVEKVIRLLPVEGAEEVWQEAVRILTAYSRPTIKMSGARWKSLGDVWANVDLAMLAAKNGNAVVVLKTVYCSHEIVVFLDNLAYRRLAKDSTKTIVLKNSLLADYFEDYNLSVQGIQDTTGS